MGLFLKGRMIILKGPKEQMLSFKSDLYRGEIKLEQVPCGAWIPPGSAIS